MAMALGDGTVEVSFHAGTDDEQQGMQYTVLCQQLSASGDSDESNRWAPAAAAPINVGQSTDGTDGTRRAMLVAGLQLAHMHACTCTLT